jgi:ribose transport system substrate-binding protein
MRFVQARQVSSCLACVLLITVIAGCNRQHVTTIAVIPKASADLFWQSVHAGAVKAGLDNHMKILWDGPPNEVNIATAMQIVETMINRQVDAIALAPSDRSAFKIVVERAARAGIPVVIYDSGIETDRYFSFVATDNYLGGQMGADRLGEVLQGKGKIVMVKTTPGGASTTAREDGFRHEIQQKFPNIRILDERFGMATISQAITVTENMMTAHPDLDGVFSSSESATEGTLQALKARHNHMKLVGFDSSPMLVRELKAGWIDSLVIQDPFKMGEMATDLAAKAIRRESAKRDIFLPPHVVNLSNIDDPAIQTQLHPDLEKYLGASND